MFLLVIIFKKRCHKSKQIILFVYFIHFKNIKEYEMALAMIQFSYKSETVNNLLKNPEDRSVVIGKLIEQLGGKLIGFYYCFGDYDGVVIAEMPDNVSLTASSLVAFAGGGTERIKTTILISVKEAMAAMEKAKDLSLPQPKG
jgi:uncharacterized protein with GYD domain